jgi:hypothetical protein
MPGEPVDFKKAIEIGEDYASASFMYKGLPSSGMMAWLDSDEMKNWWRADNVIIEPYPGGMFYIAWSENNESNQHAIYGSLETVDAENNCIEVSKISYMSPMGKLGPLHLEIRFEDAGNGFTKFWLCHRHQHEGQLRKLYNAAVYAAWPKTFALFVRHLEKQGN